MSAIFPIQPAAYLDVFMIFLRLLGLFLLVPGFSHRTLPPMVKLLLALVISLALYPVLKSRLMPVPEAVGDLVLYVLRESAIGFLMGFVAYLTFEAINLAAQFVGYQMGFGAASLVDPANHASVSVLVPFTGWIALMIFLATDMHHHLLELFVRSFEISRVVDMGSMSTPAVLRLIVEKTSLLFVVAVKMAAPFTLLVLASNCAVGILSRMLPQMHMILFVFPVTIFLGICTLYLLAPDLIGYFEVAMEQMSEDVVMLMRTI